jgi:hypothetical protein
MPYLGADNSFSIAAGYIKLLCPWKCHQEASNEAAFQRSIRKTGNDEPHSNRCCAKKDGADRRTGDSTGPVGTSSGHLKQELETAREAVERVRELEVVAAQRADLLNEKDKELAVVREALTERSLRIQELEHTLAQIGRK